MEIAIGILGIILASLLALPAFLSELDKRKSRKSDGKKDSHSETLSRIRKNRVIRVGVIPFPPLASYAHNEGRIEYTGFYVSVFKALAEAEGLRAEFTPLRNDKALSSLLNSEVDAVACLLETASRQKKADFCGRFHTVHLCGVVRKNNNAITKQHDLRSLSVTAAVVEGEIGAEIAADYFGMTEDNGRLQEIETDDVTTIFSFIEHEHADVAITDGVTCKLFFKNYPERASELKLAFDGAPLVQPPCGVMVREGDEVFRKWLDGCMVTARRKDEISEMESRLISDYEGVIHRI